MNDGRHIFVFGSNLSGRHGAGAALTAYRHWGAVPGVGWGRTGMAYAIPTKDGRLDVLPLSEIQKHVEIFLAYAGANKSSHKDFSLTFLVTAVGCGLAGYSDWDVAPLFASAPDNCILPEGWPEIINRVKR